MDHKFTHFISRLCEPHSLSKMAASCFSFIFICGLVFIATFTPCILETVPSSNVISNSWQSQQSSQQYPAYSSNSYGLNSGYSTEGLLTTSNNGAIEAIAQPYVAGGESVSANNVNLVATDGNSGGSTYANSAIGGLSLLNQNSENPKMYYYQVHPQVQTSQGTGRAKKPMRCKYGSDYIHCTAARKDRRREGGGELIFF